MKTTIISSVMLSALALTACSDDKFAGDQPKDWEGTTQLYVTSDDAGYDTYYKPAVGRVGDPMPFYDAKAQEFKVLYLQEFLNNDPYCFHPFYCVSTKDGANYEGMGEILPTGGSRFEADAALGTGCAMYNEADGLYYIYYTGHTSKEVVMRATSPDFKNWTKDQAWVLNGPDFGYSDVDFRDPQIFKADDGKWHMVISSKNKFAEFVSDNMKDWQNVGSFNMVWDRMCECPDIFKMGNKWYLIYSEAYAASWSRKVKYMMADSWEDLKRCFDDPGRGWGNLPNEGVLDTRAFYAGKTASNGTDRYIWGWSPYRTGSDYKAQNVNVGAGGEPNWSGALVCHKLVQDENGFLSVAEVPAMAAKYNKECEVVVKESNNFENGKVSGSGYVVYNRLGYHNHISFTIKAGPIDAFGISFVRASDVDRWYTLRCETNWYKDKDHRIVLFEEQGPGENVKWRIEGAEGYYFPIPADNTYNIDIYTDNSVVVMYVNGNYGTTQRIYGIQKNCWAIDCYGGEYEISNVKVSQY